MYLRIKHKNFLSNTQISYQNMIFDQFWLVVGLRIGVYTTFLCNFLCFLCIFLSNHVFDRKRMGSIGYYRLNTQISYQIMFFVEFAVFLKMFPISFLSNHDFWPLFLCNYRVFLCNLCKYRCFLCIFLSTHTNFLSNHKFPIKSWFLTQTSS